MPDKERKAPLSERLFYKKIYVESVVREGQVYHKYKKVARFRTVVIKRTLQVIFGLIVLILLVIAIVVLNSQPQHSYYERRRYDAPVPVPSSGLR